MPGFLGNESSFNERFARPVLASKDGRAGAKGAEAGKYSFIAGIKVTNFEYSCLRVGGPS
jgi:hypothetical protein